MSESYQNDSKYFSQTYVGREWSMIKTAHIN